MSLAAEGRRAGSSLTPRLMLVVALIVVVVAAVVTLVAHGAIAAARQQQLRSTDQHLAARLRTLDEDWRNLAYAVRQQLELWQAGDAGADNAVRDARLRTLLVTLADQSEFSHAAVVDRSGRLLFSHGTRGQAMPPVPQADSRGQGWTYSEADRTVYRSASGAMRYGNEAAQLVLFFPVDNALLKKLVFPDAVLLLRHGGAAVARADAGTVATPAVAGALASPLRVPWSAETGAPVLEVDLTLLAPLTNRQLLLAAAAGAVAFVLTGWLVLGRWVQSQSRRLGELQRAATEFAGSTALTPALEQRLDLARGPRDDISTLADSLATMMRRIEQARAEQAQAAAALEALNLGLESRVAERTHELEAARDAALAGARAKEQFLSNMSHEIRTPMNGMLGALDLMSRTELSPRQAQFIEVASASGEALLAIINEVLDFAKIGAGHPQLACEPMDVNAVAQSVTTLFAASAQRKGLQLRLQADPALAGWRLGDAMRLRQVLMNLVGNALKFTQRGEIVVRTHAAPGSDRITFEVTDTGPGIDPGQQQRIFEPFVQAEGPGPAHKGGTGLGLAISRQLVRAMGGELGLASQPGAGSTFAFELALAPAAGAVAVPAPTPGNVGPLAGRVLLVEDNDVNRLVASCMLESIGLEVVAAENGERALELLSQTPVSLVLMDCQMPVMDGYEATQRLRAGERTTGTARKPVIALTANATSGDVERCFGAGMDAHLGKPFSLDQLHATLRPWLAPGAP